MKDSGAVADVLKQLMAHAEVKETRAMIAASDSLASFRILRFAKDVTEPKIDSFVRSQLPSDGIRMGVQRYELRLDGAERTVYAVAYDRPKVQELAATVRLAGLEPTVVELKSLCIARATPVSACVVLDLDIDPGEVLLIDDSLPRLWHSFKVDLQAADELTRKVASAIRAALAFYERQPGGSGFSPEAPVLLTSEQSLSPRGAAVLETLVGRPVQALPLPPRVPPEIQHGAFLACLGLIMRRR